MRQRQKQLGLPIEANANHRNTKDNGSTESSCLNLANKQGATATTDSQVPQFQISVPASFQISQPNFYMEVDPSNLSENTTSVSANNRPTSNFAHTANIDEDYDT